MRESLRARLLLWHTLTVTIILSVFAASICYLFWRSLIANVDRELSARAAAVAKALRPAGNGAFDLDMSPETRDYFQAEGADAPYYSVWSSNGTVIDASNPDLPLPFPGASGATVRAGRRELTLRGPEDSLVLVGRGLQSVRAAVRSLALTIAAVGLAALSLSLFSGWLLAGRALAPIARIGGTARAMADGDLAARIPIDRTETELGQVAVALNSAFDRLDEAAARQRQFTADASHELRTPLATLQTEIEWALSRDRTAAQYRESLAICRTASARMTSVVQGLLTLARADANELPVRRKPTSVASVVDDVVTLVRPLAARRAIQLIADCDGSHANADPELLRQALSNLVTNAVQHSHDGGRVDIVVTGNQNQVIVRVRDTGTGIAPEHLPRIFERFYRVDGARTGDGGTGLGLALTKWIVERHDGTIGCRSEPGQGSEFVVELPAAHLPDQTGARVPPPDIRSSLEPRAATARPKA